jgi:uncharacterized protein YjaZ
MERFEILGIDNQPSVVIDPDYGQMEFKCNLKDFNIAAHCESVLNKIKEYFYNPQTVTNIIFSVKEFNPTTAKWLLPVFKTIKYYKDKGYFINIKWYLEKYDDNYKTAIDYCQVIDLPIKIMAV